MKFLQVLDLKDSKDLKAPKDLKTFLSEAPLKPKIK